MNSDINMTVFSDLGISLLNGRNALVLKF